MSENIYKTFEKDPDGKLDYQNNWEVELRSDTISSSEWEVEDSGITIESETNTTTTATVVVSGGEDGNDYVIVNKIELASGNEDARRIKFKVCKQ